MVRYPYGSWPSPLSAAKMASGATRMSGLAYQAGQLWWSESRPADKGRTTLVRSAGPSESSDIVGDPWSVRSSVHEYGGASWWLGSSCVYFVNWEDQRIYQLDHSRADDVTDLSLSQRVAAQPVPITPEPDDSHRWRYADGDEHRDGDLVAAVRETHSAASEHSEPVNEVVVCVVQPNGSSDLTVVATGADFYAAPRFSPDGSFISWIEWNHPQMPWDGTELYVAEVTRTVVGSDVAVTVDAPKLVAGNSQTSIMGANWTSGGQLVFSNDQTGFWNLECYSPSSGAVHAVTSLSGAEIGAPQWVFGTQQWVELSTGDLAAVLTQAATDSIVTITSDVIAGSQNGPLALEQLSPIESTVTRVDDLAAGSDGDLYVCGLTVEGPSEIAHVVSGQPKKVVHQPGGAPLGPDWISKPQAIEFASGNGTAHAFYYPPNGGIDGHAIEPEAGELPPLIVMGHGGPTSHSAPAFSLKVQYWTSRGFGVADVNYRGSTGFGRDYRRMLNGQWGVVDVEDCIAVADYLAAEGLVDPKRMAIRGGSAGGFTVLRALETSATFGAGTSLYGVADLEALATDTHKFESRYLDGIIGPYPERQDIYKERSPINHTAGLNCPLLVLQGTEDKVVPPSQSEAIVEAVAAKGLPHAYIAFEGEQHGFRQADTIVRSFEIELWFYSQVFGFDPADEVTAPSEAVGFD